MKYWWMILFTFGVTALFGNGIIQTDIIERMPNLVMQLGIIIIAARFGAMLVEKIGIPGVIGELLVGVIIGPYLLGSIPIPGFEHGLFASTNADFPIQPELYGIAIIASIILLFMSGLETDLTLFIRFSLAGTIVGISGIIFSFFIGAYTAQLFLHLPLLDPKCMFMGIMSTATSVGITARILSDQKKMDTPEGVTIISGAVIDDVLGIVLLAVVLGMSLHIKAGNGSTLSWDKIGLIAFKEIGIWLSVTLIGLYFARKIGNFLKIFKDRFIFSIMAFSIALIIAGLFERAGLAMIIGAYVVGLTLSKTDISFAIQEAMHPLRVFFIPVFFTVMGMLVNIRELFSPTTLIFGMVYTVGAILAKYIGCGLPPLLMNFNFRGANRIGLGMIPRGEVALIIAGIGLSYGFLSDPTYNIFGIAIFMTMVTTLISPPLLSNALKSAKKGMRHDLLMIEKETLEYNLDDEDLTELMTHKIILQFQSMGFFVNQVNPDSLYYNLRRHNTNISLIHEPKRIILQTDVDNVIFTRRMVHEAAFFLKQSVTSILSMDDVFALTVENEKENEKEIDFFLPISHIIPELKAESKEGIVWELIEKLRIAGKVKQTKSIYYSVMEREKYLSAGLAYGLAIPHAHINEVSEPLVAFGIKKEGFDFGSIDKKPTYLVFLILTPEKDANIHIRILASISRLTRQPKKIAEIIAMNDETLIRNEILDAINVYRGE